MRRWIVTTTCVLMAGCLACAGCARTYQDPATGVEARYEWETLRAEIDEPISTVFYAAKDAAEELDLELLRCALDGIAGEIIAFDANRDDVDIHLEALPESRSLLAIRIGVFGSVNKSEVLFSRIGEELSGQENAISRDYYDP